MRMCKCTRIYAYVSLCEYCATVTYGYLSTQNTMPYHGMPLLRDSHTWVSKHTKTMPYHLFLQFPSFFTFDECKLINDVNKGEKAK